MLMHIKCILLYNGYRFSFQGVKLPVGSVDHHLPSNADVKERVTVPLLPLWAFIVCSGVNVAFTLTILLLLFLFLLFYFAE
jgi:hypothetical protein